jgi:hypothetical protein
MIANRLQKLIESGDFKVLVAAGIIPISVESKLEIYLRYAEIRLADSTAKVRNIVLQVADEKRVSEATVYNALKFMRQE